MVSRTFGSIGRSMNHDQNRYPIDERDQRMGDAHVDEGEVVCVLFLVLFIA